MKNSILVFIAMTTVLLGNAQSGYMDNALNYSMLIKQKTGEGVYRQIGVFKVVGTPYFFGGQNKGDLFGPDAKAYNIKLSYNTYNQEVEFFSSSNPEKPLIKEPGSLDSFIMHASIELGMNSPRKFVYGKLLSSSDKAYFMELYAGKRFSVYKKYKSDLGYVSSNYIQSELRQFDLIYEYYYYDSEKPGLKKLKQNTVSIAKELKGIKDVSSVLTDAEFTVDQEAALRKTFEYLNQ